MPFDNIEKRRHPRYIYSNTIEFIANNEPLLGLSVNLSKSGICLYTSNFLNEGQYISINTPLPEPYNRATVRWIKKYSEDFYKVGLMFVG